MSNTIFADYQSAGIRLINRRLLFIQLTRTTLLLQTTIVSILMTILTQRTTFDTIVIAFINFRPEAGPVIDGYFSTETSDCDLVFILNYRRN